MKAFFAGALLATAAVLPAAAVVTISNTATGVPVSPFGSPDTLTYGEVFTAPITGKLTSFTLSLNGGVGALDGGVGTWNGTSTPGLGFGSPTNQYLSGDMVSLVASAYTFTPNIKVTAGQNYVAYLTVFGVAGANATTSMPLGNNASGVDYFVFNNGSSPFGNTSWNYFFDNSNALFSATFAAVPAPASLSLLGLGAVALTALRRKRA